MRNLNYALHSVAAIAIASLATACSNEDGLEGGAPGIHETIILTAWQPGSDSQTRIGFNSNGKAYWQGSDAIGVWSNGENKFNSFSIASGAGTGKATFSGEVTGGVGQYAVYPYNAKCELLDNTLNYYLPESYVYESVEQTFFPEDKDGKSFCMPMYGTVTDNVVKFHSLGGVICLLVDKMPAESGTVTVVEYDNKLCGAVNANLTDATPEIKTSASSTDNTVTFTFSNATEGKAGVFYLPVATGIYNLVVGVEGGEKISITYHDAVQITRTKLQAVKVVTDYEADDTGVIVINGHNFVDLGLPSGLLWAETNIGAEREADEGYYFAWGETKAKESYSWSNYKFNESKSDNYSNGDICKYNSTDNTTILEAEDDAAYVNWGTFCRMPTKTDFIELNNKNNCTWTWVSKTTSDGRTIDGYEIKGHKTGNSIFLPASGYRDGGELLEHGSRGIYWSSKLVSSSVNKASYLFFYSDGHSATGYESSRSCGRSVRPVAKKP